MARELRSQARRAHRARRWAVAHGRLLLAVVLALVTGCTTAGVDCSDHRDCAGDRCCVNGRCQDSPTPCPNRDADDARPETEADAADAEEPACPPDPEFTGTCPAACSGGCDGGTCLIACATAGACQADTIQCPEQLPCRVACAGVASCQGSELRCAEAASCALACDGVASCQEATLRCGQGACAVACAGEAAGPGHVECGPACRCEVCDE